MARRLFRVVNRFARRFRGRRPARAVLLIGAITAGGIGPAGASAGLTGVRVFGWGFWSPPAVASDGTHVWVVNYDGGVTELDASTGAFVRTVTGPQYGFGYTHAIAADGASAGRLIQVLDASVYQFTCPHGVAIAGGSVWVPNGCGQSVTAFPGAGS